MMPLKASIVISSNSNIILKEDMREYGGEKQAS